ncbi:hypothetical protein VDGD_08757 [Verticillium dahliae]|nr:hypothetical protein VDGD_08757 [Verticillium dahliae]
MSSRPPMMATATSSQCPDQPPAHDPSSLLHATDVVPPTAPDEQRPPSQADGQLPPNPTEEAAMALRKLLKGKEEEWSAVSRRTGRLTLLELPFDILRLIVNEVCRLPVPLPHALSFSFPFPQKKPVSLPFPEETRLLAFSRRNPSPSLFPEEPRLSQCTMQRRVC